MIKIIYNGVDFKKISQEVLKTYKYLHRFFPETELDVKVYVFQYRKEFDKRLGEKTEDWVVGNASLKHNYINILSPLALKNESCHNQKEFSAILKHEFTHLFIDSVTNDWSVPKWLGEGLAQYVAKQYEDNKDFRDVESDFCQKLGSLTGWNNRVNRNSYQIASLFVYFLVKKYSFKKIKELLASLDKKYSYPGFRNRFFKVYQEDLSEVEKIFIDAVNKKAIF